MRKMVRVIPFPGVRVPLGSKRTVCARDRRGFARFGSTDEHENNLLGCGISGPTCRQQFVYLGMDDRRLCYNWVTNELGQLTCPLPFSARSADFVYRMTVLSRSSNGVFSLNYIYIIVIRTERTFLTIFNENYYWTFFFFFYLNYFFARKLYSFDVTA